MNIVGRSIIKLKIIIIVFLDKKGYFNLNHSYENSDDVNFNNINEPKAVPIILDVVDTELTV